MIEQDAISSKINEIEEYVIQVCGIREKEKFYTSRQHHYVHARWLYFYAIRIFTHMTYANMVETIGERFGIKTEHAFIYATNRMMAMIDVFYEWGQRWRDVQQRFKVKSPIDKKQKVIIIAPKDIDIEVRKE